MTPVSTCPKCGAPIYMPTGGNGTQLPMAQHTCMCRFNSNPVKELTDMEMLTGMQSFLDWNRGLEKPFVQITNEYYVFEKAVEIYKAILRKAQEK